MAVWHATLHLKDILSDDVSYEGVRAAARAMHERLEAARVKEPLVQDRFDPDELEQVSDEFHTIGFVDAEPDLHYFNSVMASLYDWADRVRVWVA